MLELTDIHMPHMGSVEFALLTEWLIKPGEEVNEGDALCEVSTDKVDTEVESPESGILISYVASIEQEVPVGDVIARFAPVDSDPDQVARAIAAASGEQGGDVAVAPSPAASPSPSTVATPVTGSQGTPAVVFEESKPPTDSLVLAASWFSPVNRPPAGARRGSPAAGQDQQSAGELASKSGFLQAQKSELTVPTGYEDVAYSATEHTRLRRAIAKNLAESWNTAPQLTAQVDVDFSAVSVARAKLNRDRASRGEAKLSYLPFIAVALCKAIAEHPVVNATFTDTHLLQWQTVNLGLAVDTPDGFWFRLFVMHSPCPSPSWPMPLPRRAPLSPTAQDDRKISPAERSPSATPAASAGRVDPHSHEAAGCLARSPGNRPHTRRPQKRRRHLRATDHSPDRSPRADLRPPCL